MTRELQTALQELSERGTPRGADDVVTAAFEIVAAPRRRRTVVIRALAVTTVAFVALTAAAFGYVRWRLSSVDRVALASVPAPPDLSATTFLVVGSDSRAEIAAEDEARFGSSHQVTGARADSLMMVRIDPDGGTVSVLSIPRDLLVSGGDGRRRRVNGLLEDGPAALVETVSRELQIEIDHYVAIEFDGFRRLVDALGGVVVPFGHPTRDRMSGLAVPQSGCARLDGADALALVRSRDFEQLIDGRWQADPTGDLGRIQRQQEFVRAVFVETATAARTDPVLVNRLLRVAAENVTIDDRLSLSDVVRLGRQLGGSGRIDSSVLPVVAAELGGAAVLELQQPAASSVVAAFLGAERPSVSHPAAGSGAAPAPC